MLIDYRGARGSNTGDDFHELWVARQAICLLSNDEGLEAIAVEGLVAADEHGGARGTWDGVDCALYFGGRNAAEADHIQIAQLKYSAANPERPWTVARLIEGRRGRSVVARLAKAWKGLKTLGCSASATRAVLVSNQPIDPEVRLAVQRAAASLLTIPTRKPRAAAGPEVRLAYAAVLEAEEFRAFASELHFEAGAGSRFALEEQVLRAIADWTDESVQQVATELRQFVRRRMLPESARETITRESVLLHLGTSEESTLFPCPSEISRTKAPVRRASVRDALGVLRSEVRHLCLHGPAGVGKTTALQEIEEALPKGSVMVKDDCYGGGRYLDPGALRHRPRDAFIQLTNDLAFLLRLPLFLSNRRHDGSDYPRLFMNRLRHAACALAAHLPDALIVIAVDAADNAVVAARERIPSEPSFVHDFVRLRLDGLPENVRFVVTTRTGRMETLQLPHFYCIREIAPFSRPETSENVARVWAAAPEAWIDDFHHLSGGVPRVQGYAFEVDGAPSSTALERLRPAGKSLGDIFQQQFRHALANSGGTQGEAEVARLCAALIALPRPAPLSDLAAILESTESRITDICVDLAPGIRVQDGTVSFADEDFESFVRAEGKDELAGVRTRAAERLLSRAREDCYAALHVAAALVAAGRGEELLKLVEEESAPAFINDPVLCREAELQRVRLAIKVCRNARDVVRALRFVLIGAEGAKTETALHQLLVGNPDLATRFAPETARRLILSDSEHVEYRGPLLFHKLSVDADRGDAISYREGVRFLDAWLKARRDRRENEDTHHHGAWKIGISDISSMVEAALKLDGSEAGLRALECWRPKRIALEVALTLPYRLLAEEREEHGEAFQANEAFKALVTGDHLEPIESLFLLVPLALAGQTIDVEQMACGLDQLSRRKLRVKRFFRAHHFYHDTASPHTQALDTVLTACEILTSRQAAPVLVDRLLDDFLAPDLRRIDRHHAREPLKLHFLFRAYALRERRAGRIPDAQSVFEPRPAPDEGARRHGYQAAEDHDRPLKELTGAVFCIYAAVSDALVNRREDAELEDDLRQAIDTLEREKWRIPHEYHANALRGCAATHLFVLAAAGYAPRMLKRLATDVHGRWRSGNVVPDDHFVARLSLWSSLHGSLLEDLAVAATETRTMRIGANDKSETLASLARLMKPLSEADAKEVFNAAVEVASELDYEARAQIQLLDKLVSRGADRFMNARATARKLGNIVSDAAVRLDGFDHFPWEQAMGAVARLDASLALANAARWDDEALVPLRKTLAPVLKAALRRGTLEPEQAAALAVLTDDGGDVIAHIIKQFGHAERSNFPALAEEAAYDVLIRQSHCARREVMAWIEQHDPAGPWSDALLRQERFLAALPREPDTNEPDACALETEDDDATIAQAWRRAALVDSALLQQAVQDLWDRMQAERRSFRLDDIFESARRAVSPADRTAHLSALGGVDELALTATAVEAILEAVDEWQTTPSVQRWCRTELPNVIVARLPRMTPYPALGEDNLTPALMRTGMTDAEVQEHLLEGLERHVNGMDHEWIFALAGMIGCKLARSDAASLVDWYAERLEKHIAPEYRDQTAPDSELPRGADEAVARFLFASLCDCDLRQRWRAAHAVRRLARTGGETTMSALAAEYRRCEEPVFRAHEFYWLAARLWFVLAWDRVAGERPEIAARAERTLLAIALDHSFPHLLVRSFARDACEKLVEAGHLSLTPKEASHLAQVNKSPLPRVPADPHERKIIGSGFQDSFAYDHEGRRFRFDPLDTLPYWYDPMLKSFAAVEGERFLREAERWIVDVWGHRGDAQGFVEESRRDRFNRGDWTLTMHRHGSKPTLERLRTHLEWHAMWCAAGELLKTEPLAPGGEDNWYELGDRIDREKLVEPPLWSADLLVPTPLIGRNWRPDKRPLDDWAADVQETDHRAEIFPGDSPRDVTVAGSSGRCMPDRVERISVSSALVEPTTCRSLLRALQTMDDSRRYKLPDEGEEDVEIDQAPYRLLGWLRGIHRDDGIDRKDPFRGSAFCIDSRPGCRVSDACDLTRDAAGRPRWSSHDAARPMFVHEAWGEDEKDEERYRDGFAVSGRRLLADREQLLSFLRDQELDLVIEVVVIRHARRIRQFTGENEDSEFESRFTRLYRLDGRGALEIAEGHLGTWTGDRPPA